MHNSGLNIKIEKITMPEDQKTIDLLLESKGIRLDIYVKDDVSMEVEFMNLLERDREKIEEGREED